jgi:hypothetical protein
LSPSPAFATTPPTPASERAIDAACACFALWTLCCHAVVALGGSLHRLELVAAAALASALALFALRARRRTREVAPSPQPAGPLVPPRDGTSRIALRALGLLLGLVALGLYRHTGSEVLLWWCALGLLAAAAVPFALSEEPATPTPRRGPGLERGLWVLALACAALALFAHRIDLDDVFYVNLAVAAADEPGRPLLREDTLHGIPGLPLHLPVYRLHSYELLNAALSHLTGLPALAAFHLVSTGVAALLVPLAYARLFRRLTPRHWLGSVVAVLVVLWGAGEVHRWYGNFAFVRLWHGKSIALCVFLPLVYSYALDFALAPSRRRFAMLCAAQIAALGATSTALWAAPLAALIGLASALRPRPRDLRRLALGALASLYVLGAAFGVKLAMDREAEARVASRSADARVHVEESLARSHAPGVQLEYAFELVLSDGRLRDLALLCVLVAWALCGAGLARRFAIVAPLVVVVLLLDPYTTRAVSENLTGPSYWRVLWALPIPVLMALVLVAPLELATGLGARSAAAALLAGFVAFVPRTSSLSPDNGGVELRWPGLRVPDEHFRWARALDGAVAPGAAVVAPLAIGSWIPTLHGHGHPLVVRGIYLRRFRRELGMDDLRDRWVMTLYAGGELAAAEAHEIFRRGLERYRIAGVCLKNSEHARQARSILRGAGFERTLQGVDLEIWVRGDGAGSSPR